MWGDIYYFLVMSSQGIDFVNDINLVMKDGVINVQDNYFISSG